MKIKKIINENVVEKVYDITVKDNHNFIANGVVVHNCHKIGATMFLRSFTRFSSAYRLGLSATPNRDDGMDGVYLMHLSKNIVYHKPVRNVPANVCVHRYEREKSFKWYPPYIPEKIALLKNLIEDENRNKFLFDIIKKRLNEGRKVLFISERIIQLKLMMQVTKQIFPKLNAVRFFGEEAPTKKEIRMGKKKLPNPKDPTPAELNQADIIFATYSKAKEGTNVPALSCLILGTPVSNEISVIQVSGRIERQYEGKPYPVVDDIFDMNASKLSDGMYFKRQRIFESRNMKIQILDNWE